MANQTEHKQKDHTASQRAGDAGSAAAGQKGVSQEQVGSGKEHDPNNFANDPARAAAAGRKGGRHSHDRD